MDVLSVGWISDTRQNISSPRKPWKHSWYKCPRQTKSAVWSQALCVVECCSAAWSFAHVIYSIMPIQLIRCHCLRSATHPVILCLNLQAPNWSCKPTRTCHIQHNTHPASTLSLFEQYYPSYCFESKPEGSKLNLWTYPFHPSTSPQPRSKAFIYINVWST